MRGFKRRGINRQEEGNAQSGMDNRIGRGMRGGLCSSAKRKGRRGEGMGLNCQGSNRGMGQGSRGEF